MTTRREYFVAMRAALLEVKDRERGAYILFHPLHGPRAPGVPRAPTALEVHERLFPLFTAEVMNQSVYGTIDVRTLLRHVEHHERRDAPTKGQALAEYEALVLALGQQVRDLITGDPTALWNVYEERRRRLAPEVKRLDDWATQAERSAVESRARAEAARVELVAVEAEQARLTALAAERSST